jgi:hypothetical protein
MAVNVTEKDKTLNEIIDWCEQLAAEGLRLASALLMAGNQRSPFLISLEPHDYCRYLFDENHVHGVPDKWSKGHGFALSLVMFKCHTGLTNENRKAAADWREKHWKDTK